MTDPIVAENGSLRLIVFQRPARWEAVLYDGCEFLLDMAEPADLIIVEKPPRHPGETITGVVKLLPLGSKGHRSP